MSSNVPSPAGALARALVYHSRCSFVIPQPTYTSFLGGMSGADRGGACRNNLTSLWYAKINGCTLEVRSSSHYSKSLNTGFLGKLVIPPPPNAPAPARGGGGGQGLKKNPWKNPSRGKMQFFRNIMAGLKRMYICTHSLCLPRDL